MRPANSGPRSARISSCSSSSIAAASSLRLVTRSAIAPPSDDDVRLSPPLRRFHQLALCAVVHVRSCRARDSRFGTDMTPEEMLARLLYRDGLMLVIDKPAGLSVHRGPKGGDSLEDYFDALRFGLPRDAGAGAPARQRHLRLPGARPPPQGAGAARQAVQAGQDRQDLLGGGRGRARRRRRPHRHSARQARRRPRLVDEGRSERRAVGRRRGR